MAACVLLWIGLGWWAFAMAVQWASAGLARLRRRSPPPHHRAGDFSIIAPLAGAHDATAAYIGDLAALSRAGAEVLICVADEADEAVAPARQLWPGALSAGRRSSWHAGRLRRRDDSQPRHVAANRRSSGIPELYR